MRAVTVKNAEKNLDALVSRDTDDSEPAILLTDSGRQDVLMPLDDFNAWQETHYLLSVPADAAHLRRSIEEAGPGLATEHELLES